MEVNGKVRRTGSACCQFVVGKTYEANINSHYVAVVWDNGEWSSPHWASFAEEQPLFEIIEKYEKE